MDVSDYEYQTSCYNLFYVYAIDDEKHKNYLKIGKHKFYSSLSPDKLDLLPDVLKKEAEKRVKQQTRTAMIDYEVLYAELAFRVRIFKDGCVKSDNISDDAIKQIALNSKIGIMMDPKTNKPSEWYKVDLDGAKKLIKAAREGRTVINSVSSSMQQPPNKPKIQLRKEQTENIEKTTNIFKCHDSMLWNCKMRYGKTVTAYSLIKKLGYKRVIVITHRPAVEDSWEKDHDWIFYGTDHRFHKKFIDKASNNNYDGIIDKSNSKILCDLVSQNIPFTYFSSMQDLRGSKIVGGKFNKNNAVFNIDWELVIIDEAHEGTTTYLGDAVIKALVKKNTKVLFLSGTPYKIMKDFDDNIYTWTYVDEQRAKRRWSEEHPDEPNPYEILPDMNILTFDLSSNLKDSYRFVTENMAFNFREFFRTWMGDIAYDFVPIPPNANKGDFVHESDIKAFLDLITTKNENSNYPFATEKNRDNFKHTFWLVPGVKEARALSCLLKNHPIFMDYRIVNIAGEGDKDEDYDKALHKVQNAIAQYDKTITISCERLTTGVTVPEWTAIMMLAGSSSTEATSYMQAIFRVQSPGFIDGKQKTNCYVFDFAPDRTLKMLSKAHRVDQKGESSEETSRNNLGEFLNFCPVISFEGTQMRRYDVDHMMREVKKVTVEKAINSGFDDDTIYKADTGIVMNNFDIETINKLSDVVSPQKKGKKNKEIVVNSNGLTNEEYESSKKLMSKPIHKLTPEERAIKEKIKEQRKEQQKILNLLRAVSIRLPLLFYGAEADISEIIKLEDFVKIVDDESWEEFMPKGLRKDLFLDLKKFYDEDVLIGAGMRIRKLAKAADEYPPTVRAAKIVEIISKFKNPDKETVLTPWRVVNMHLSDTVGGYSFYNENFTKEVDNPNLIDHGDVTSDIFLNPDAKVLEINSKSGLYPLYMAYSFYMLRVNGKETNSTLEDLQKIWFGVLENNIFVLCKTKMARSITIRTLAGYTKRHINAIYLTKLLERMKNMSRLTNKLTNPNTWNKDMSQLTNKLTNPNMCNKEGKSMEFDVVVGNPPYQENISNENNNFSLSKQLFPHFIITAIELNSKYISLITPSRWFTGEAQDKSFIKLREYIKQHNHFKKIFNYPDKGVVFKNEIAGGVNYFLYNKEHDGNVEFTECSKLERNTIVRPLFEQGLSIIISMNNFIGILNKVIKHKSFVTITNITTGRNAFGVVGKISELSKISTEKYFDGSIEVRCAHELIRYTERKNINKNNDLIDRWKVFTSKGNGGAGILTDNKPVAILGKAFIGKPGSICTDSLIAIGNFDTEYEASSLKKYMISKFLRFMVGILKVSQNVYQNVYQFVPLQNFTQNSDIDWSKSISEIDKQLYSKYGLSEEEISFIESRIKPMN